MTQIFTIDANVFVKLLNSEPDSEQAKTFMRTCVENNVYFVVPELFIYEVVAVTKKLGGNLQDALDLFDAQTQAMLSSVSPNRDAWKIAEKIANS